MADIDAKAYLDLFTGLWSTQWQVLGGNVAFVGTLPVGGQNVSASAALSGGGLGASIADEIFTVGDPVLGASIGWHSGDLHWSLNSLINVPIGDYQAGEIANVAFHRWGADVSGAMTWLNPDTGLDISGAVGFTFNGENPVTDYRTGTEFHAEWAVVQNFSPQFSAGLVGYYYQQLTADSGDGATLGEFKGRVAAIGGTVGWNFKVAETPVSLRVKIYREFAARNRLEGTSGFLTVSIPLSGG